MNTHLSSGFWGFGIAVSLLFGAAAQADAPQCLSGGRALPVDNVSALQLKQTAPLGKPIRAHVSGRVTRVFPDRNGHAHFEIQIGDGPKDLIEVVYSEDFGDMPNPNQGSVVEACGDFLNSYTTNNGYPPSPSGAIIHWVHRSNSARHDSGYVLLENIVYGNGPDRGRGFYSSSPAFSE